MCIRNAAGACLIALACAQFAAAQSPAAPPPQDPQKPRPAEEQQPPPAGEPVDVAQESPVYKEQVVVSASKNEEALVNAPAAVSIITSQQIVNTASSSYADLFRSVPGVNVTQTSARDINITTRGATSTLSTSQLALVDGRSIYLDFFGFIAWDFLPVNPAEIKQIEVIRGPASAIWGANALNGVVNVITKTPRELPGHELTIGVRRVQPRVVETQSRQRLAVLRQRLARPGGQRALGLQGLGRCLHAGPAAASDRHYPERDRHAHIRNSRTRAPRSRSSTCGSTATTRMASELVFQGGVAGTDGILHSGIGPFDIDSGTVLGYGKVNYQQGRLQGELLHQHPRTAARRTCSRSARTASSSPSTSRARRSTSRSATCRTSARTTSLTYGGNFRQNLFDLTIAPAGDNRTEGGAYAQDEIFLGKYVRWVVGARVDKFDNIDDAAVLAAHEPDAQAVGGADGPPLVQPRVPRAVGDQQLPRHGDPQPAAARIACQSGAGRPRVQLPDRAPPATRSPIPDVPSEDLTDNRSPRTRWATRGSSSSARR